MVGIVRDMAIHFRETALDAAGRCFGFRRILQQDRWRSPHQEHFQIVCYYLVGTCSGF